MDYLVLVMLHVTAVIIWVVSMMVVSILIAASADGKPSAHLAGLGRMRAINRYITAPFMVLAWVLGITLTVRGGWFGSDWLSVKLAFVLTLSAIHGVQSKTLRKWATLSEIKVALLVRLFPVIIVLCVLIVISLALTKPF